MNIALVDDIREEMDIIESILHEYAVLNHLDISVSCFESGEKFLENYKPYSYTVIFVDIYMAGMDGVDMVKQIRRTDNETIIIFLTTSEEHYPDAFRYHAYEYVKKPAGKERIFQVMDDILDIYNRKDGRLFITYNRENISIPFCDIVSVVSNGHNTEITDRHGKIYTPRLSFTSIAGSLSASPCFLLVNRGILVNMDYIIDFTDGSCLLEHNNKRFPINVRKQKKIEQIWKNYTFSQIRMECAGRGYL